MKNSIPRSSSTFQRSSYSACSPNVSKRTTAMQVPSLTLLSVSTGQMKNSVSSLSAMQFPSRMLKSLSLHSIKRNFLVTLKMPLPKMQPMKLKYALTIGMLVDMIQITCKRLKQPRMSCQSKENHLSPNGPRSKARKKTAKIAKKIQLRLRLRRRLPKRLKKSRNLKSLKLLARKLKNKPEQPTNLKTSPPRRNLSGPKQSKSSNNSSLPLS